MVVSKNDSLAEFVKNIGAVQNTTSLPEMLG